MSDAPVTPPPEATAPDAVEKPAEGAEPAKPDRRSEIARLLKEEGVKLKAKDREVSVTSLEDLTSRAQRVFGMESMLEEAKKEKAEAEKTKAWRQRLKSRDESAFDEMEPEEQVALAEWYEKKAAEFEKARELPPEVREAQKREAEMARRVAEYEKAEAARKQEAEEREEQAAFEALKAELSGTALKALKALKIDGANADRVLPRIARVMRHPGAANLTPDEVAALVASEMQAEWADTVGGLKDDGQLYDFLGEETAKRVMREALRRRGRGGVQQVAPPTQQRKDDEAPKRGTPAYLFR